MATTDVVEITDEQVHEIITGGEVDFTQMVQDPKEVQRQIAERILSADDADSVLVQTETTPGKDMVGVPITIKGVRWMQSRVKDRNDSLQVYALIDAVRLDDGEAVLISCGAMQVVAQLVRFKQLDALPIDCMIGTTDEPTASGYYPLWLEKIER